MAIMLEIENLFRITNRGVYVGSRLIDPDLNFYITEKSFLGGVELAKFLEIPRSMYPYGEVPVARYTDGKLNIDTNPVENAIRPVAIGRKNYLFAGSHEAAQRSDMLYPLLGTCKLHDTNPFIWLKKVLELIPSYPNRYN